MSLSNPLPPRLLFFMFLGVQLSKLLIILSQPNSQPFKDWFYGFAHYEPYSLSVINSNTGLPFPVPYSLLWYAVYAPLTLGGYWVFNFTMLALDTAFGAVIIRHHSPFWAYLWVNGSMYFLLVAPQDFLIWLFILLGRARRYGPVFLVLAVLTKLPALPPAPPAVWAYFLNDPYSIRDSLNIPRYFMLGFSWLTVFFMCLVDGGKIRLFGLGKAQNGQKC